MRDTTKSKLEAISTATLTTVLFKRGFRNTFIAGIHRIQGRRRCRTWSARPIRCAISRRARISTISACSRTAAIRSARASRNARPAQSS